MEEVITEPYVTIKMDQANLSLMSDWMGSPTTEQFKEGKSKMLDVLVDHSLSVMVLNYHNMVAYLNLETQVWAINEWFPKVINEKIKRVGVVIPSKVMAQIVVKSIYSGLSKTAAADEIEISYFDNVSQLHDWVNNISQNITPDLSKQREPSSTLISRPYPTANTQSAVAKKPVQTGVDLGGGPSNAPSTPDYSAMDDEIHDDPFA